MWSEHSVGSMDTALGERKADEQDRDVLSLVCAGSRKEDLQPASSHARRHAWKPLLGQLQVGLLFLKVPTQLEYSSSTSKGLAIAESLEHCRMCRVRCGADLVKTVASTFIAPNLSNHTAQQSIAQQAVWSSSSSSTGKHKAFDTQSPGRSGRCMHLTI